MPEQKWPDALWIVRHGQSAGNVARDEAERAAVPLIDIATRDMDVPLSPLGEQQAAALGALVRRAAAPSERPTVVLSLAYVRARARRRGCCCDARRWPATRASPVQRDERLREKEFGILDRLTKLGIRAEVSRARRAARARRQVLFPPARRRELVRRDPAPAQRARHDHARVPGRARADRRPPGDVNCLRYLLERMTRSEILDDRPRAPTCRTARVTSYAFDPSAGRHGKLVLRPRQLRRRRCAKRARR